MILKDKLGYLISSASHMCEWRPALSLILVFVVLGLINPRAEILFLTSSDELEGYFVFIR